MRVLLTVFCCCVVAGCGQKNAGDQSSGPAATNETARTQSTNTASVAPQQYAKLLGRWQRPDGGYILNIQSIDPAGKLTAEYLNPNPINISRAYAFKEAGETKVFVELKDVHYPGCTYALKYDTQADELVGQYYQAALGETYDIVFSKLKEE